MQKFSLGRFVLAHALIAGILSLGFPSWSGAAPRPQSGPPPVEDSDGIQLTDVLLDAAVNESSAARVLVALGVPVPVDAAIGLAAEGDQSAGGEFGLVCRGERLPISVLIRTHAITPMIALQRLAESADDDVAITLDMTMSLASCTIAFGTASKPILCLVTTIVAQPAAEGSCATTTTGVSVLGEAVNAMTATAYVRQIQEWSTPVMMEQQSGGGIPPPGPPGPPTMIPCCTCDCIASGAIAAGGCATAYAGCLLAVGGAWLLGLALCALTCAGTGPLFSVCFSLCMGNGTPHLAAAAAACLAALTVCEAAVAAMTGGCILYCGATGQVP